MRQKTKKKKNPGKKVRIEFGKRVHLTIHAMCEANTPKISNFWIIWSITLLLVVYYTLHQKKVTFSSLIFPGDPRLESVTLGHFQNWWCSWGELAMSIRLVWSGSGGNSLDSDLSFVNITKLNPYSKLGSSFEEQCISVWTLGHTQFW